MIAHAHTQSGKRQAWNDEDVHKDDIAVINGKKVLISSI